MVIERKQNISLAFTTISLLLLFFCFINVPFLMAQNYSFSPAIRMDSKINSTAEESMPLISPDGNKIYFVRTFHSDNVGGKYSGQDIWMSAKNEFGVWGQASNDFRELNNDRNNAVIGINRDETAIFLTNSYNPINTTVLGISRSIRIGDYWSKPNDINIKGLDSKNSFIGFFINKDENVLLISMNYKNTQGEEDLFISQKNQNGEWSEPENLGTNINTPGYEISPFLTDDGKTLFFSSNGHSGYGDADIYMSRRLYDSWGIWSEPINLGTNINSPKFDAYFNLNGDEAYFASNRDGGLSDIYISKLTASEVKKEVAPLNESRFKLTETEIQELMGMPVSRNIYFEFGSSSVAESSIELINYLASKLTSKRQYLIELIGHTDKEGTDEFNQTLSEHRATEVGKYFQQYGIDSLRISTKGVGESQPIIIEGTNEEIAKNRRVEIYFVK